MGGVDAFNSLFLLLLSTERNRRGACQHPMSTRRMVALYDYDPRESSPNLDVEVLACGSSCPQGSLSNTLCPLTFLGNGFSPAVTNYNSALFNQIFLNVYLEPAAS